jgi:hypothetical protein
MPTAQRCAAKRSGQLARIDLQELVVVGLVTPPPAARDDIRPLACRRRVVQLLDLLVRQLLPAHLTALAGGGDQLLGRGRLRHEDERRAVSGQRGLDLLDEWVECADSASLTERSAGGRPPWVPQKRIP